MRLHASLLILALFCFGCKGSNFSSGDAKETPEPQPSGSPQQPKVGPAKAADCGDKAVANVTLLSTQGVRSEASGQFLEYQMEITCFDKPVPITANSILFDIDVVTGGQFGFLLVPFRITDMSGKSLLNGSLTQVSGSDLFGNKGNFFHHKTNKTLNINASIKTIKFIVDLSNQKFKPRLGAVNGTADTFLRFDNTPAVKKNIKVVGSDF